MPEILEYEIDGQGSPFGKWFWRLPAPAAGRITVAMAKLERGLRPNVEAVGQGVFEAKVHFGPGYRVYFANDGDDLIILLGGGDKRRQEDDIVAAQELWSDYRSRKERKGHHGAHS